MSSAAMTAVAVPESPRQIKGQPKSIVFDAQLYQSHGQQPLLMNLCYFNEHDMSFMDDVGVYLVHATVST